MKPKTFYRAIGIAIAIYLIMMMAMGLISCNGPKKAAKAVDNYKQSSAFAKDCADQFPAKETTTYLPGETKSDTLIHIEYIDREGPQRFVETEKTVYKTITKSRTDTIKVEVENTARAEAATRKLKEQEVISGIQIQELDQQLTKANTKVKNRTKQRNVLAGIVGMVGLYVFRRPLAGLGGNFFGIIGAFIKRKQ